MKKCILKVLTVVLVMVMFTIPVSAATPRFNNIGAASLLMAFDTNYTVYVGLNISPYTHGSGVSGLVKLFDSEGTCLAIWPVSDYEKPLGAEFTYPGIEGETYTATFAGYAYSNNGTAADRLELEYTAVCR
ncbi:MAG: hypothetical protein IKA09_02445 [Lachnospiraceae bacterium]|nr:hypothetical protein [Lachnospiraceae bacterium]